MKVAIQPRERFILGVGEFVGLAVLLQCGEKLISFSEATRRLPGRGRNGIHIAVLFRWAGKGIQRQDGETVRLDTVLVGGKMHTSDEALRRFLDQARPQSANDL